MLTPVQGKQYHCYMATHLSVLRLIFDTPVLLYIVIYNSWRGFDQRWNDAYDSLWIHLHMATILFEAGALPPSFANGVVCLERMHMHAYRFITSLGLIIDMFMVVLAADDVADYGNDGDFISRLVLVLLLLAVNVWRTVEIWSNVTVHDTRPPEVMKSRKRAPDPVYTAMPSKNRVTATSDGY